MPSCRRVQHHSGPDSHGTVTVTCPYCNETHYYTWNAFRDDHDMARPAGCLRSNGGNIVINLHSPPPVRREESVQLVQPTVKKYRPHRKRPAPPI